MREYGVAGMVVGSNLTVDIQTAKPNEVVVRINGQVAVEEVNNTDFVGILPSGGVVYEGKWLMSYNNQYIAAMQTDGNIAIYKSGSFRRENLIWESKTNFGNASYVYQLEMNGNGTLRLFRNGVRIWYTPTISPAGYLWMQNDGNVAVYSADGYVVDDLGTGDGSNITGAYDRFNVTMAVNYAQQNIWLSDENSTVADVTVYDLQISGYSDAQYRNVDVVDDTFCLAVGNNSNVVGEFIFFGWSQLFNGPIYRNGQLFVYPFIRSQLPADGGNADAVGYAGNYWVVGSDYMTNTMPIKEVLVGDTQAMGEHYQFRIRDINNAADVSVSCCVSQWVNNITNQVNDTLMKVYSNAVSQYPNAIEYHNVSVDYVRQQTTHCNLSHPLKVCNVQCSVADACSSLAFTCEMELCVFYCGALNSCSSAEIKQNNANAQIYLLCEGRSACRNISYDVSVSLCVCLFSFSFSISFPHSHFSDQ